MNNPDWAPSTLAVAAGRGTQAPGEALNVPITLASNFHAGAARGYARGEGTPTWDAFEQAIGALEGGTAVAFSSGMAAVSAVLQQFGPGTCIVVPDDMYQGVTGWLTAFGASWQVRPVPANDDEAWARAAVGAQLVWVESPTNPLLQLTNLRPVIAAAKAARALVVVDNTFATPLTQTPLALGADVVVHSATKFIGGHSDLLAGVAIARDPAQVQALRRHRTVFGSTPGALEMFLALRGLRTLPLRFERAQDNARRLVGFLRQHPAVANVRYPVQPGGHPLGFGAVVSFEVRAGAMAADAVASALRVITHATSIGGVESTIERRAKLEGQEHLPPGLLRLAVGIEDARDLENDLTQALAQVSS